MGDSSESEPRAEVTEGQDAGTEGGGESLADAARDGRELAGQRLREDLGREPTDAEIDEWLRQQTEGY